MAEQTSPDSNLDQGVSPQPFDLPRVPGWLWLLSVLLLTAGFVILNYLSFPYSGLPEPAWRYWLLPPAVLFLLLLAGARFVHVSYQLSSLRSAFRYLLASFLPIRCPTLLISDGKAQVGTTGVENLVQIIGGPGKLDIQPGNAVLLEGLDGGKRVLGAGKHFITRLESVKDVLSLEERNDEIPIIKATTRDGIEVHAHDIHFRYRLYHDDAAANGGARSPSNLYPFSEEAVIRAVYNRTMGEDLGLGDWHKGIKTVVDSVIAEYIRQSLVDHLIVPVKHDRDPRAEILSQFSSDAVRTRFREKGAELIWIDIGYFDAPEKRAQERWMRNADVVRAFGEVQRRYSAEVGRAVAQAKLIMDIVQELEDATDQNIPRQDQLNLYLTRLDWLIDALEKQHMAPPEEPPNP